MRTVKFVIDSDEYVAGQIVSLEDQTATNAIAHGFAVPNDAHVFGVPEPAAAPVAQPVAAQEAVVQTRTTLGVQKARAIE